MVGKRGAGRLLVALAMLVPVQACSSGSGQDGDRQVATLASAGSTPAASASAAAAKRPRERLDTTPEEFEAMLVPFNKCVREHGAKPKEDWRGQVPSKSEIQKLEAANKACEPLYYPLPPWEKDPANPEAKDFARDVVACLKGKGVKYVEVGENGVDISLGGEQNDRGSITKGMDLMPACEREVVANRK
ncbi:hypothetical protein AB0J80_25155 [Actinoplanes sp. NPDC049548]|uniref:hypothetical protein n=1 Tax=Actinoplanes sp. NPDC049548 TaxID=3155152 RepID=UPI0034151E5B